MSLIVGKSRAIAGGMASSAKGNGVADDTAAIQADIQALENRGGGVLYLPKGTFNVSAPIRIKQSGIVLVGAGESTKILGKADSGHIFDFHPDSAPSSLDNQGLIGCGVENMVITTDVARTSGAAIYGHWTRFFRVSNVRIGDIARATDAPPLMYDGIYLHGQDSMHITDNVRIYMSHYGIYSDGDPVSIIPGRLDICHFDGRIDGNVEIWGPLSYNAGSACVVFGPDNGGISISNSNLSWAENAILCTGSNREIFIGENVYLDDTGDCGFNNTGSIYRFQAANIWAAGCGRGSGPTRAGYNLGNCAYAVIAGGRAYANNGSAIRMTDGVLNVSGVQMHTNGADIEIQSGVTSAVITGNLAGSLVTTGFVGTLVCAGNSGIDDTGSGGGGGGSTTVYSPLVSGDPATPELVFSSSGDVIMCPDSTL